MYSFKLPLFLGLITTLLFQPLAWGDDDGPLYRKLMRKLQHQHNVVEFAEAEIFLEQNFTDGDSEVVLLAKGGDVGIKQFWVFSPENRLVYKFRSPANDVNIGGREIVVESPEPADLGIVLNAYPEGEYSFIAKAYDGQRLHSVAQLTHDIPPPVSITFPAQDGEVSRFDFEVVWETAGPSELFLVELKNEDTEMELLVQVPGDRNSFRAPEEWLVAGAEYQLSVGVVNPDGNLTFVEQSTFTLP